MGAIPDYVFFILFFLLGSVLLLLYHPGLFLGLWHGWYLGVVFVHNRLD